VRRAYYAEAIPEYEAAIALNRNSASAYANLGRCKFYTGSLEEVIPLIEQAVRLSPRDPLLSIWYARIRQVHMLQSHTDEAILWLERARSANPARPLPRVSLAAAYGIKGEGEHAAAELAEARRLSGDLDRFSTIARFAEPAQQNCHGAEDPRLVRSHIFRWSAQGRNAGGVTRRQVRGRRSRTHPQYTALRGMISGPAQRTRTIRQRKRTAQSCFAKRGPPALQ
jgi:tetratricopeptide (TPR) repeat protein